MATPCTERDLVTYPDRVWLYLKAGADPKFAPDLVLNENRRHLSETQRAMIAARLADMPEGRPGETTPIGAISNAAAGQMFGIGHGNVYRAKAVLASGLQSLIDLCDQDRLAVSLAYDIVKNDDLRGRAPVGRGCQRKSPAQHGRSARTGRVVVLCRTYNWALSPS